MQSSAGNWRIWFSRRTIARTLAATIAIVLLFSAIGVLTQTRLPRWAAGLYGGMCEKIRRHPEMTAAICLAGVALTWGGIGLVAAIEGRGTRKPTE